MVVLDEGLLDVNCHCEWGLIQAEVEVGLLQVTYKDLTSLVWVHCEVRCFSEFNFFCLFV